MPPSAGRFAIKGRRPGEVYHTPFGIVSTDPIDGGARLSEAQKKYFDDEYSTVKVAAAAPVPEPEPLNERQQQRIAENQAASDAQRDEEARVLAAQRAQAAAATAK